MEEFLGMVEREELLEYALVYGDYKEVSKQQIRECLAKGCHAEESAREVDGVCVCGGEERDGIGREARGSEDRDSGVIASEDWYC